MPRGEKKAGGRPRKENKKVKVQVYVEPQVAEYLKTCDSPGGEVERRVTRSAPYREWKASIEHPRS